MSNHLFAVPELYVTSQKSVKLFRASMGVSGEQIARALIRQHRRKIKKEKL